MLKKIVIIGAGPCGLLLAHYLLRRGQYEINIYERRQEQDVRDITGSRTFSLSLQERGRKALRGIPNLEETIKENGIFCVGSTLHNQKGKARQINRDQPILTLDRNVLVSILLDSLKQNYSAEKFQIKFNCDCQQIDQQTKTVILQPKTGDSFTINYDVLIGTDGANSRVRTYLAEQTTLSAEQSYIPDAYTTICLNRTNPDQKIELAADRIHASNMDKIARLLVVPQPNDTLNGVMIFDAKKNPLESLTNKEEVLQFFTENFPTFAKLMSEQEAEALLTRPTSRVKTVRCDRFHEGDSILIIGDAAHAVSPSIGQGCNSALEDVLILDQLLTQYQDNWQQVLPIFSQQRVPEAHALQDLSNYAFPRGGKWLSTEFIFRLIVSRWLNKWFPRLFQPFILNLIFETDLPYTKVLNSHQGWINRVKQSMG